MGTYDNKKFAPTVVTDDIPICFEVIIYSSRMIKIFGGDMSIVPQTVKSEQVAEWY